MKDKKVIFGITVHPELYELLTQQAKKEINQDQS